MREIQWTDEHGFKKCSLIRDNDPDEYAPYGIPTMPPDVAIILEEAKLEIHNNLVERKLFTWRDVQVAQNAITAIVNQAVRNKIIILYKEADNNGT